MLRLCFFAGSWVDMEFDSRPFTSSSRSSSGSNSSNASTPAPGGAVVAEEGGEAEGHGGAQPTVYLTHLRSYSGGMGTADVTCLAGCTCRRSSLDGTWERRASLQEMHKFAVGWAGGRLGVSE
jgi:hypothetical protein